MDRRRFLVHSASAAGLTALPALNTHAVPFQTAAGQAPTAEGPLKGRLRQSVCRWCYGGIALDELCRSAARIGLRSVELLGENEWNVPAKYGLTCAVANGPTTIPRGWNRLEHHDEFVKEMERMLPLVKAAGLPNIIVFSGNRDGQDDGEGIRNCVKGLKRVTSLAEQLGVTIVMELLNSKVDHRDYQCDHTPWGVEVVQGVSSPRFKLLYDIYHMQIMEGDVIRTVLDNLAHIAHFHTGGVPGRNEIDQTQELNYSAICQAIVNAGFGGYLAQEFIPKRDAMVSLRQAAVICDV